MVPQDSKRLKTSETSMNRIGGASSAHKRVVYKSNYLWGCDLLLSITIYMAEVVVVVVVVGIVIVK